MVSRRTYDDGCAFAQALDLIGERWALLVVRELVLGPKRFTDLRAGLSGISPNVLTQRLGELEHAGVLRRRKLPPPAATWVYELTEWGYETRPIFEELGRWAARSPAHDPSLPLSAATVMMSFRTMFAGTERTARIGVRFPSDAFLIELPAMRVTRAEPTACDVTFATDPWTLASLVYGGRPFADAETKNQLTITGDRQLAEWFVTSFPLPAKVSPRSGS